LAMDAAEHKPGWGEPYFVAANSIVEGIKNCNLDPFDKQAAFWLAADYAYKAKVVEPKVTDQANELIAQYRSNYPSVEETFFRSLKEGDSFQIGCWINETTTVKTK
ncbi:MAG: tetratricopeptide repeat protein, partial [Bacteroidales bacterium]